MKRLARLPIWALAVLIFLSIATVVGLIIADLFLTNGTILFLLLFIILIATIYYICYLIADGIKEHYDR